eukprot:gene14683-5776_t
MFMFFRDNELAISGDDFSHSVSLQMDQTEVIAVATQDTSLPTQPPCSPTSQASVRTIENETICRICLDRGTEPLVAPCKCAGSAKFAHESCLLQWFFKTRRRKCELCLSEVNVKSVGFKPLQKWRLPTDSCDFVFYLFTLYCVIMFVFTGMIIWIATQGCLSPVCITLYVICSMSLVYFIYCCGCVEYSKTYWKACVTTNKNWRIYNREETSRTKAKASRVVSNGSESCSSKKCSHVVIDQPDLATHSAEGPSSILVADLPQTVEQKNKFKVNDERSISGSTTIYHSHIDGEETRRIDVMSTRTVGSPCDSPVCLSPVFTGKELAHTGSISLLMELNYSQQHSLCVAKKDLKNERIIHVVTEKVDTSPKRRAFSVDAHTQTVDSPPLENESKDVKVGVKTGDGVTNSGFDDTKL